MLEKISQKLIGYRVKAAREAKGIDGRDERVLALLAQAQTLIAIEEKAQVVGEHVEHHVVDAGR